MFLHVDLDAFFSSVEQLINPELKGKPVIVGALPNSKRGVVSTCSYEARKYGVHSAMPISQAYRLCPNGIYIKPKMNLYNEKSQEIMNIFKDFSPDVQQMSIDEAFIDLTGTERLFGPVEETAKKIKETVFEKTGLVVSVGLASNKYIAKIASGLSKPDGFYFVKTGSEFDFMSRLPLSKVWGIGKKTLQRLNSAGLFTVPDLQNTSLNILESILGKAGADFIYKAVRGLEAETFSDISLSKSISAEKTYSIDLIDRYAIGTALLALSHTVMFRMIQEGYATKTICVKIRYDDFSTHTVQETNTSRISSVEDLYQKASNLFDKRYNGKGIRLLGICATNLENKNEPTQVELFQEENIKRQKLEKTILSIQSNNPDILITKARLMKLEKNDN